MKSEAIIVTIMLKVSIIRIEFLKKHVYSQAKLLCDLHENELVENL